MTNFNDIVHTIPKEYLEIDEKRSWFTLLRCIGLIVLSQYLLTLVSFDSFILLPILWIFAGLAFVGLFALGHDCGHYAFSKNKNLNVIVGHLVMSPLLTGYYNWMYSHGLHHRHTQKRKIDPDWPERMVTREEYEKQNIADKLFTSVGLGTPLGLLAGFFVGMVKRIFIKTLIPQLKISKEQYRNAIISNLVMLGTGAIIISIVYTSFGTDALIKHFAVPAYIGMFTGALLTFLHHSNTDSPVYDSEDWNLLKGQVISTYDVRFPRILEWIWLDINIHTPHHVLANIPWYHLRPVAKILKEKYPELYNERPFSFSILTGCWKNPLLKYDETVGGYKLTKL